MEYAEASRNIWRKQSGLEEMIHVGNNEKAWRER